MLWLLLFLLPLQPRTAKLAWDDPNPAGTVAGFAVYHAFNVTNNFAAFGQATTNQFPLPLLQSGTHFFYVTAIGTNGFESDPSNQVFEPVVQPPQGTAIIFEVP